MAFAAASLATPENLERGIQLAETVDQTIADQAGLTRDADYEGWYALAVLAYAFLWPPIKDLRHMQLQLVGLFDQAYKFFGGAGKAIEGGIKSIESAGQAVVGGFSYVLSGRWL